MVASRWVLSGLLAAGEEHKHSPFVRAAVHVAKNAMVRDLDPRPSTLALGFTYIIREWIITWVIQDTCT